MYEGETQLGPKQVLAVRATPVDDRSFETFESAQSRCSRRRSSQVDVAVKTGYLDVLFAYPIQSAASRFSIDPKMGPARGPDHHGRRGSSWPTAASARSSSRETPAWSSSIRGGSRPSWRFVKLGFRHILDGTDHLLFLFCLVIPFRRFRSLVTIVTAFTVAHSITLIASAYNLGPDALWFPPLIETLIATSIVYMALENIVGANLHRRWLITFGFGLVHGFGFSFALKQTLQFAGSHLLTSLLSFNIGVELGQLLVLMPAHSRARHPLRPGRAGTAWERSSCRRIVAHTGWHWMTDRFNAFRQYDLSMPEFTPAFIAELLRYAMALVALAGVLWAISVLSKKGAAADEMKSTS